MSILTVYREPFSITPKVMRLPEGETLERMAKRVPDFPGDGTICVNGTPVPRALWGMVRPKPHTGAVPIEITMHAPIRGGGGEDGKNAFAIIATFAIMAVSGYVGAGNLGGFFAADAVFLGVQGLAASTLATGIALAGSLLIGALTAPPTRDDADRDKVKLGNASAEGNRLEPNGPVPRVVGTRKIFPPLACEPLTYFDGPDEVVEAAYVLAGPHQMSDVRIGNAPIGEMSNVDFEVREGWKGDDPLTLVRRQARTETQRSELRGHVTGEDGTTLETATTGSLEGALPIPLATVTRSSPDEVQMQVVFPQGLHKNADDGIDLRVPMRVRIRPLGSTTWRELVELHYREANVSQLRATIKLLWTDGGTVTTEALSNVGWVNAFVSVPGQTDEPATDDWNAESYFYDGSGDTYLTPSNSGTTGVKNIDLDRYTATVHLDRDEFPPGRYEVEIKRGYAFRDNQFNVSAYQYNGNIRDFFRYVGTPAEIDYSTEGLADAVYVQRIISIWDENPIPTRDFATVAIRARNREVAELSVRASGYVPDLDTGAWTTTSYPAPHLVDIWTGVLNADPVPSDILDMTNINAWHDECVLRGYECNAIFEGMSTHEAARIVASCGYAKPMQSEVWGVVFDRPRDGDSPVQIFTPRNSSNFSWEKGFARLPDGFLITYRNADEDYDASQIVHPDIAAESEYLEQVSYEGLVTESEVRDRAEFDLKQAELRSTFYSLDVPAEAIICRRGSLVGVVHDSLSESVGYARLTNITTDGAGDVTHLMLDSEVPFATGDDMHTVADMHAVADMHLVGRKVGVVLRRTDGTKTVHEVSAVSTDPPTVTLVTPAADTGLSQDVLVAIGPLTQEYERMIVFSVEPREDLTARLTLVDEARELFAPPIEFDMLVDSNGDALRNTDGDAVVIRKNLLA